MRFWATVWIYGLSLSFLTSHEESQWPFTAVTTFIKALKMVFFVLAVEDQSTCVQERNRSWFGASARFVGILLSFFVSRMLLEQKPDTLNCIIYNFLFRMAHGTMNRKLCVNLQRPRILSKYINSTVGTIEVPIRRKKPLS